MKRVLLIKAASIKHIRSLTQPLGLMYLSSFIKSKSNKYEIKIFDNRFYDNDEELIKVLHNYKPEIVGISCITQEANNAHKIASYVKRMGRHIPVVAGGPHPTQFFEDVLKDVNIDYVVRGEGEEVFLELCERLNSGCSVSGLVGVSFRSNNGIVDGGKAILRTDINDLPFPDYDSIDMERYFEHFSMATIGKRRYAAVSFSRGCPYECIYCHNIFGRKYRFMSPERAIAEIDYLVKKYHITDLEIVEDIFNLRRDRTEKFLDMLIERGYNLRLAFPNGLRTDLLDDDLLYKFKKAGTVFISFAIESASHKQQREIKKRLDLEKARKAIEIARKLGIICNGFFMLGFPDESRGEIIETVNFAINSKLHTAYFFIVNPFKGTELYEKNREKIEKMPDVKEFENYSYFIGTFNLSRVPTDELLRIQSMAYKRFYLNPNRIFSIILAYSRVPASLKYLFYYGIKTFYLIGERKLRGLMNRYAGSVDKAQDAS